MYIYTFMCVVYFTFCLYSFKIQLSQYIIVCLMIFYIYDYFTDIINKRLWSCEVAVIILCLVVMLFL